MRTPLHEAHVSSGARMGPFAGWDMPIQYAGILKEHEHTRGGASVFDTCHMGEFDLRGPGAEADLERLLTQPIRSMRPGQCRYGYMLAEDGGVLDDLIVFRRGPEQFFVVVNAGTRADDAAWIQQSIAGNTAFRDLSEGRGKLDVQGPRCRPWMEDAFGHPLPDLGYFRFQDTDLGGIPCTLSRTGYTGEWGYELYFDASHAMDLWNRLTADGRIRPAGLGARDTLRLEMGYPLYGHELSARHSPVSATGSLFINTEKEFRGKPVVLRELDRPPARRLAALRLASRRAARAGDRVRYSGEDVGRVTSGAFAPSIGVAVALAYIDRELHSPGTAVTIETRGTELPATVTDLPFYTQGTARKSG